MDGRMVAEATGRFLGATPSEKAELKARYGVPKPSPDERRDPRNDQEATHTTTATR
jgi:hypothetical protein